MLFLNNFFNFSRAAGVRNSFGKGAFR